MDYTKLTKQELIEKLKSKKHLSTTVHSKDVEIGKIKVSHRELVSKLNEEAKELKNEINILKSKLESSITREELDEKIKGITEERDKSVRAAQLYIKMYHNYLKQIQHNLDMALFTEQVVSEKFK